MSESFRDRLRQHRQLLGTMLTLSDPTVAEILAAVDFDWLFIDGEHGPLDAAQLQRLLQVVGRAGPACLVRTPSHEDFWIKRVLDLGAAGVIVPQVNSAAIAEQVVASARYAPAGQRGVGLARAHGYGIDFARYVAEANDQVCVVVQAEHAEAVEHIESIVQVPGIDAVLIGPYDLSASMGLMGEITHPDVQAAIAKVTSTCHSAGIPLGIFGVQPAALADYVAQRYSLLVAGVDALMLATAARGLLGELRKLTGAG